MRPAFFRQLVPACSDLRITGKATKSWTTNDYRKTQWNQANSRNNLRFTGTNIRALKRRAQRTLAGGLQSATHGAFGGTASWRAGDLVLGASGSPAHFPSGRFLIMRLRILDGVVFEISRVLESFFDRLEYQEAKRASVKKRKEEERNQPDHVSDPLRYLYPNHLTK